MNTSALLGCPWPLAKKELDQSGVPYKLCNTCVPGRAPFGNDVRVVQIKPWESGYCITVCSFVTSITK